MWILQRRFIDQHVIARRLKKIKKVRALLKAPKKIQRGSSDRKILIFVVSVFVFVFGSSHCSPFRPFIVWACNSLIFPKLVGPKGPSLKLSFNGIFSWSRASWARPDQSSRHMVLLSRPSDLLKMFLICSRKMKGKGTSNPLLKLIMWYF